MGQLVTIFGGSGFVGRYIAQRMAKEGWRVRVACRRPNEALFVKPYGAVGQVEPIFCNIRDEASVRAATQGADAVVNCVGTFDGRGRNNFEDVQDVAATRIARIAHEENVKRLVHISAIGADAQSPSRYGRSKADGEAGVLAHFPSAVILRPSVIFGTEDEFFNRFAGMARLSPILPLVGGTTKFQPVYVDDVAKAASKAMLEDVKAGIYELAGPNALSLRDIIGAMLKIIRRRALIVNMPFFAAGIMARAFDAVDAVTLGLIKNKVLTPDQLEMLHVDNVAHADKKGFADLGIEPTAFEAVLPDYLWRFRPAGQYTAIQESAKNLRQS